MMKISPAIRLEGTVKLPGDKSLSHRHILRAALVCGRTLIRNLNPGEDVAHTLKAVEALGVRVTRQADGVLLESPGRAGWHAPAAPIDCGNSGTTARLLMGLLAGCPFDSVLVGDESLSHRPMERVAVALRLMGAEIHTREGAMPVEIKGRQLKGMDWTLPVPSAQLKSAVIFAALYADGDTRIEEAMPSRDHTERMLGLNPEFLDFGSSAAPGIRRRWTISQSDIPTRVWDEVVLPADPSAASFFVGAAAVVPDAKLFFKDVLINPYRRDFIDVLEEWGLILHVEENLGTGFCGPAFCGTECSPAEQCPIAEPVASIKVTGGMELECGELGGRRIPRLIDEIPLLAAVAIAHRQKLVVKDAAELRLKESDRIDGICRMARAFGAKAEAREDGFTLFPADELRPAVFDAEGDHRLAMAAAVLALAAGGESTIQGDEVLAVSNPLFLEELKALQKS
jgi:3-phosphoshikimate 1-carboxyvinyltransferase